MGKTIAIRGKKEIVAVFNKYARLAGNQDQGRPQSATDFVKYIAERLMNEDTKAELKAASKLSIDVSNIEDNLVPASIKIPIEIDDEEWNKAMEVFRYVFDLKGNPQMPYFIRVAGMACIKRIETQNAELGIIEENEVKDVNKNVMDVESFKKLSTDDKLIEIYKLLIERGRLI